MKKTFLLLKLFCINLLLFYSCKKSPESTNQQEPIPSGVLMKLTSQGYNTEGVRKVDGGYIVENDMFLPDSNIGVTSSSPILRIAETEQYRTNYLVTGTPRIITLSPTNLPAAYTAAIDAAILRYNNLNLRLALQRVAIGGMIDITDGSILPTNDPHYTPPGVWGVSGFPANGNPQNRIGLNVAFMGIAPNQNFLTTIIAHETGHCIGMRHTDYFNRAFSGCSGNPNEGQGTSGAINIPGTPTAEDPNSWMLACINSPTNRPFNANDVTALQWLYGNGTHAYSVTETSCDSYGHGTYTVSGFIGDVVTIRIQSGGYLVWNNVVNGAGVKITLSGPGTSNTVATPHYTNNGNTYSLNCDITFTMTSNTATLYSTILKYNVTSNSSVSGSIMPKAVNNGGIFSGNSANVCIGSGIGTW